MQLPAGTSGARDMPIIRCQQSHHGPEFGVGRRAAAWLIGEHWAVMTTKEVPSLGTYWRKVPTPEPLVLQFSFEGKAMDRSTCMAPGVPVGCGHRENGECSERDLHP